MNTSERDHHIEFVRSRATAVPEGSRARMALDAWIGDRGCSMATLECVAFELAHTHGWPVGDIQAVLRAGIATLYGGDAREGRDE